VLCSVHLRTTFNNSLSSISALVSCLADFWLDDGGDTFLRNVGAYTDYTIQYPTRWRLSYLPLWEPPISARIIVNWRSTWRRYTFSVTCARRAGCRDVLTRITEMLPLKIRSSEMVSGVTSDITYRVLEWRTPVNWIQREEAGALTALCLDTMETSPVISERIRSTRSCFCCDGDAPDVRKQSRSVGHVISAPIAHSWPSASLFPCSCRRHNNNIIIIIIITVRMLAAIQFRSFRLPIRYVTMSRQKYTNLQTYLSFN
jgi:hypothetical protein